MKGLKLALEACLGGRYAALVTGPLQKSAIIDAGIAFSGHTEFLADATNTPLPVMLLVAKDLRVALVTTHLPLSAVPGEISRTAHRSRRCASCTEELQKKFAYSPTSESSFAASIRTPARVGTWDEKTPTSSSPPSRRVAPNR